MLLDGDYQFRVTVQEANSNEKYPFRMNLSTYNNHITGDVNYFNDGCSGIVKGKILSSDKIELSETITRGSNICANGTYLYDLKHQIISKANSYTLENKKHSTTINKYEFTPAPKSWHNVILKEHIAQLEIDIDELRNDINITKQFIEKNEKSQKESKYYLEHNSTLINGECTTPPLEPKPDPFYDTKEKAKHYALAYCSVSFGCRVGVELARDKLDTGAKRFLASQSCTLMVRNYQKNDTLIGETMFNLLDAVSYEGCDDSGDGLFSSIMQGGSCVMSGTIKLVRVQQYINCIAYKTEEFHNTYLDWKNAPTKKKTECEKDLKIVNDTPKIIVKHNEEISNIKSEITVKNTKLKQLNDELREVLLLREKQSELIKVLTK